jgi:kinesin family member 5
MIWFAFQRAFATTSAGIEGGKSLAESAQDLERTRKAITVQLAEFDGVKKSLMRDLQNRCEKVGVYCAVAFLDC